MKEPDPERRPPPSIEPELRVGLVLPEDRIETLSLSALGQARVTADGMLIPAGADVRLALDGGLLQLLLPDRTIPAHKVVFSPSSGVVRPQSGFRVSDVVAGRGFHWQKRITATYPGTLEASVHQGSLLLVNKVPFESYLQCVVASEMSAECPQEFVRAQAVTARSWAWCFLRNKHERMPYTICNDDCCQRYQGTSFLTSAGASTGRGQYLIAGDGSTLPAYYSKACGGISERPEAFGVTCDDLSSICDRGSAQGKDFCDLGGSILSRYLGAVDEQGSYYRWTISYTHAQLAEIVRAKTSASVARVTALVPRKTGVSGRILALGIEYLDGEGRAQTLEVPSQFEIRRVLHQSFLFSSAFTADFTSEGVTLRGAGWGHGVGFCQIGGVGMALQGYTAEQILSHYFPKARLVQVYE